MRKFIKIFLTIISIISIFSFFGCNDEIQQGDIPHEFNVSFYKGGNKILGKEIHKLYGELTFKISPENLIDFSIKDGKRSFETKLETGFHLPLYLNFWDNKTESWNFKFKEGKSVDEKKLFNPMDNTEIFHLTILYNSQELFDKKVKIKYKKGINFFHPEEVYYLDDNNEWQIYKKERNSLLNENNEPTGYEYSIDF